MLPPPQIGATIAQLMLHRLVEANRFRVFDGQWLRRSAATSREAEDALLAAARDAGIDYLVRGSITQFSMEQPRGRQLIPHPPGSSTPRLVAGFRRQSQ
jgi:curli biogenesis system outer membrane secretion channel CsgG